MGKYVLKRIGLAIITAFIILSLTFILVKLLPFERPLGDDSKQIAYFDKQGKVHKPFMMPAEDPEYFRLLLRSWSRPELMKEPVRITPRQFYEKILTEPLKVSN